MAVEYLVEHSNVKPYLNLSWFRRRNELEGLDSYKSGIPKWRGRAGITYATSYQSFDLRSDLFVRYESSSEELEISGTRLRESQRDDWVSVNLNLGIAFRQRYRLNLDLINLTDRKYMPATENLWAEQRSIHLKFSLDI